MYFLFLGVVLLLFIYALWANHHIQVSHWSYEDSRLPRSFEGFRIVQVSDIHGDLPGNKAERILQAVRQERPDIVVITGDAVDHVHNQEWQFDRARKLLHTLGEEFTCYYVTGNHEYMHPECEEIIPYIEQQTDIHVLHDCSVQLEENGQYIRLWGLDDPYARYQGNVPEKYATPIEAYRQHLQQFQPDTAEFHILLSHRPEFLEDYAQMGFPLVFSGHAHGGQFRGPFGLCAIAPDQGIFPKLTQHFHKRGETTMYISRGLGNSVVPLRLFNDPEIVVVQLKADGKST